MSLKKFDPNAAATAGSGIFGLPFSYEEAALVYYPVPWEATTSYGGGTSEGPEAILEASRQVDLYDFHVLKPYEAGLALQAEDADVRKWNQEGKALAAKIIEVGGDIEGKPELEKALKRVNELSALVNERVYRAMKKVIEDGKIPALIGGDHATPLGAFRAAGEKFGAFGVLHFDAHSDTREAYEGFRYSHASIMNNALKEVPQMKKLVQVGIRDFCEEEISVCRSEGDRVKIFFDAAVQNRKMRGEAFSAIADEIVGNLPEKVWVSFDIDGLDPKYCPHTGTPVAGGLEFLEAVHILEKLARSGRTIIGFDLNEVAPGAEDEWDANVGARLLYKMTGITLVSQKKREWNSELPW